MIKNEILAPDISVRLGKLCFKNPVILASGTARYGEEIARFIDLNQLGGIIVKVTSLMPKLGNPPRRIVETAGGMLSSVGGHNIGVEKLIKEKLPFLREFDIRVIVNIGVEATVEGYHEVARRLDEAEGVSAIEINISGPNVKEGGILFGQYPEKVYKVVKSVREATTLPIIAKLTPNITDITEIARAAVEGGTDILSLINNPLGMAVDIHSRKPVLSFVTGGLSGPAIKPIALRMLWELNKAKLGLPIIGIGGISNATDAIEFIITGASAIQVGSANLVDPEISVKIVKGIRQYCVDNGIENISELVGVLKY